MLQAWPQRSEARARAARRPRDVATRPRGGRADPASARRVIDVARNPRSGAAHARTGTGNATANDAIASAIRTDRRWRWWRGIPGAQPLAETSRGRKRTKFGPPCPTSLGWLHGHGVGAG